MTDRYPVDFGDSIISMPNFADYDQHYQTPNDMRKVATYVLETSTGLIHANDPIWGKEIIGNRPEDAVLVELFSNPLVNRLTDNEQLTLPKQFTTMPNSYGFMRFEHAWGSLIFVRKKIDEAREKGIKIDDHSAIKLQLRTFVSDIAHTAFSHLGDWLFQGFGGSEDLHDNELMEILEAGGVNEILRKHGFVPEEVVFPDVQDWIECSSPDLCVDRVDYGSREIGRWVTGYDSSDSWLSKFSIDEEARIIMSDRHVAKSFAVAFNLLATEHWGHPVHRSQLQLFGELIKGIITDDIIPTQADVYHPRDVLYELDRTIGGYSYTNGAVNYELTGLLLDIGRAQRKAFHFEREQEIVNFVGRFASARAEELYSNEGAPVFPNPLKTIFKRQSDTGLVPNSIEIIPVENDQDDVKDFNKLSYTFDKFLPALKPRSVDPLYYDEHGEVKRLSEQDPDFASMLEQQRSLQRQKYVARWYGSPVFIAKLKASIDDVNNEWARRLTFPRADRKTMGEMLRWVGIIPRSSEWLRVEKR